jgi:cobalt/nickel transport system permease protein
MAFLAPLGGYLIYKLITGLKGNKVIAAGIGAYIAINVAGLATAVELGLQPLLFHTASGTPLYFPYGLNLAVPAMLFAHLTVAGAVEAVITGLVVVYLQQVGEEHILYRAAAKVRGIES